MTATITGDHVLFRYWIVEWRCAVQVLNTGIDLHIWHVRTIAILASATGPCDLQVLQTQQQRLLCCATNYLFLIVHFGLQVFDH